MRAFIAISLPLEIKNALAKIQDKLRITLPEISWVEPANLHITLEFLGDISLAQAETIQQAASQALKTSSAFKIKLDSLGVFPDYRQPRLIWIGAEQTPMELIHLLQQLKNRLKKTGLPQEKNHFQTHVTLGRIKRQIQATDLEKNLVELNKEVKRMGLEFNAQGITLFQSVLSPQGPVYSILKQLTL